MHTICYRYRWYSICETGGWDGGRFGSSDHSAFESASSRLDVPPAKNTQRTVEKPAGKGKGAGGGNEWTCRHTMKVSSNSISRRLSKTDQQAAKWPSLICQQRWQGDGPRQAVGVGVDTNPREILPVVCQLMNGSKPTEGKTEQFWPTFGVRAPSVVFSGQSGSTPALHTHSR